MEKRNLISISVGEAESADIPSNRFIGWNLLKDNLISSVLSVYSTDAFALRITHVAIDSINYAKLNTAAVLDDAHPDAVHKSR